MGTAFPLGIWVHTTSPQLEVPVMILATLLGLPAATLWIRSRRRRDNWIWGVASEELLGLSLVLALVHGWTVQVQAVYALACVVYLVVVIVWSTRITRRMTRALYPEDEQGAIAHPSIGEPVSWPAIEAQLATDPHAIVVYPDKRKVVVQLMFVLAIIAGCSAGIILLFLFASGAVNIPILVSLAFFDIMGLLGLGFSLRRSLSSKPAICIYRDGIVDNVSLGGSGVGFIPWDEIEGSFVTKTGRGAGIFSQRRVVVLVTHPSALIARQSAGRRWMLRSLMRMTLSPVNLPDALLPIKADELEKQIRAYYEAHVAKPEAHE